MDVTYSATEFGASRASTIDVGGILVSLLDYAPGTRTAPHENEGTCLTVTLSGAWRIHDAAPEAHECSRGTVHLVPTGVRHHSLFDGAKVRMLALYVGERAAG